MALKSPDYKNLYFEISNNLQNKVKKELHQTTEKNREELKQELETFMFKQLIKGKFDGLSIFEYENTLKKSRAENS